MLHHACKSAAVTNTRVEVVLLTLYSFLILINIFTGIVAAIASYAAILSVGTTLRTAA